MCETWLNHFMSLIKKHDKSLIAALNALGSAGIIKEDVEEAE